MFHLKLQSGSVDCSLTSLEEGLRQQLMTVLLKGVVEYTFSFQAGKTEEFKSKYTWYPEDVPYAKIATLDEQQLEKLLIGMVKGHEMVELLKVVHAAGEQSPPVLIIACKTSPLSPTLSVTLHQS